MQISNIFTNVFNKLIENNYLKDKLSQRVSHLAEILLSLTCINFFYGKAFPKMELVFNI